MKYLRLLRAVCAVLVTVAAVPAAAAENADAIDFSRDILPVLSNHCFQCHGPDEESREGGFRLDLRESAIGEADSGELPVTPSEPDASEVLRRVVADGDEQMPPAGSGKQRLTEQQVANLRAWIEQGAEYQQHWAFVAPVRSSPPGGAEEATRDTIDRLVGEELAQHGLKPSLSADRATLLRRVTFDLTGLPPTPEEIAAFESDTSADAFEKVVDRLLASDAFGEQMARTWLDASRYADTNGYLQNSYRMSWPWRDWLVGAFNNNMSYDRFLTEMLAGDLLPDATDDTKLATSFLRMHMITSEGGSLDEEFRIEYAADRAETVGTVFLGLTMNCCRCHDHKFDPIPQQEYYQLLAMFADPNGEDPVKDHARDPAFPPFITLSKEKFAAESARLDACTQEAQASKNKLFEQRLALEKRFLEAGPQVMVMEENPQPRQNFVLKRGAYDAPDEDRPVERGGIDSVFAWDEDLPQNRLGLAQWLTDPAHPLTARVEVNRLWALCFGRGLVSTQEDFGRQGSYPTHPELLDTLSVEFREQGWDRKRLLREMVLSKTYRQASKIEEQHKELDADNLLLARMSRRRLPAEAIRDQALFVAGLLDRTMGGHPVMPYQPEGLWIEGANSPGHGRGSLLLTSIYEPSSGSELVRRSLYTFWNRNAPPPQMLLFDAPERSSSAVGRSTTNTPLQALVTMNDDQFTEAARFLSQRTLLDASLKEDGARLAMIYRRCTGRELPPDDAQSLSAGLKRWRDRYAASPAEATTLLNNSGLRPGDESIDPAEHAAWMMISTTILNLDATLVVD